MKEAIFTESAPAAIGPYSQAVISAGLVFVSGQLPADPATGEFIPGGIREQTRRSLQNVGSILEQAGTDMGKVVKTTVFLDNMENFAAMNEVYAEFFEEPYPARAAVQAARLPKDALVEIEVIAALD